MSDLISRQAVMKEFSDFVRRANNSDFAKTPTWNDAVSLVGSLPSAEVTLCHLDSPCEYQNADIAQPTIDPVKWIPVSEAMPEEADGTVLVCMPNKFPYNEKEPFVNAKHNRQVETATYSQYSDTWHFKNGGVTSVRPIAWMPLPEPWRGEEG